jgi:hypothetical protein
MASRVVSRALDVNYLRGHRLACAWAQNKEHMLNYHTGRLKLQSPDASSGWMRDVRLERHRIDGQEAGSDHLLEVPAAPRCSMCPKPRSARRGTSAREPCLDYA